MRNYFRLFNINSIHQNLNIPKNNACNLSTLFILSDFSSQYIFDFWLVTASYLISLSALTLSDMLLKNTQYESNTNKHPHILITTKLSEFIFLKLQWLAPLYWIKKASYPVGPNSGFHGSLGFSIRTNWFLKRLLLISNEQIAPWPLIFWHSTTGNLYQSHTPTLR